MSGTLDYFCAFLEATNGGSKRDCFLGVEPISLETDCFDRANVAKETTSKSIFLC